MCDIISFDNYYNLCDLLRPILSSFPLQSQPAKICSQIGLCTFDGSRGVGYEVNHKMLFVLMIGHAFVFNFVILIKLQFMLCSVGIESVVSDKGVGRSDAMCSTCEMAVVWMQNQLRQNQTQERILSYINEVKSFLPLYSKAQ